MSDQPAVVQCDDEPTEAVDVPAMVAQLAELPDAERLRIKRRIQGEYLATVSR